MLRTTGQDCAEAAGGKHTTTVPGEERVEGLARDGFEADCGVRDSYVFAYGKVVKRHSAKPSETSVTQLV